MYFTSKYFTASKQQSTPAPHPAKVRPEFQRPPNPKSALIANGWIEQQRRSKMRTVWKDVLASLVEGRRPGEETTLWIQRQIINSQGTAELEALHQIPVKWLQDVSFMDFSTDNRFSLRVYNLNEDFVFRCPRDPAAAENWVVTLRSAKDSAVRKKGDVPPAPLGRNSSHNNDPHHDEKKSADIPVQRPLRETPPAPGPATSVASAPAAGPAPPAKEPPPPKHPQPQQQHPHPQPQQQRQQQEPAPPKKMSVKEMRALAHGAGISTVGMERRELEDIAARLTAQHREPPRPAPAKPPEPQVDPTEESRRQEGHTETERRRNLSGARDTHEVDEEAQKDAAAQEAERKRQEEEHQRVMAERVRAQQEAMRKKMEEEERQRLAHERQMREEEDMRRRAAQQHAEQQRRHQEELLRQQQEAYRRQQEAWQQQQAEEERRRKMAEEQQAEQRRQQEEAYRRQQQWQQQQQPPHSTPPQWHHPQQQQQPPPPPFGGFPGQQHHPQQPPNGFHGGPPSPADNKYAQMATQQGDNTSTQHIKHAILIHWALQPPMRQGLRQIEDLITSIHTVFPPAFGVPGHEYFQKWKAVTPSEVDDEDKIEKKVKKLRFFLHPDKLPKDLNSDQSFMCRMLWDVTSDALELHKKKKEELSWIHQ